jgi:hypothetical protein
MQENDHRDGSTKVGTLKFIVNFKDFLQYISVVEIYIENILLRKLVTALTSRLEMALTNLFSTDFMALVGTFLYHPVDSFC